MAKDISDVVVLNDSLDITVNMNEVIWKIPETPKFKEMEIYEFKFSVNKHLFCS